MTSGADKTVGYIRVSSTAQVIQGAGLATQEESIQAWARYQGKAGVETYSDEAIGGSTMANRPGLLAALRAVLKTPGSTLVVYRLDRLGRSALDVQETVALLLDSGVRVVSTSDGIDSASGMGSSLLKLLVSILATFAELEKETILARFHDGRERAKAEGRTYTRHAKYGWMKVDGKLIPHAGEQEVIQQAKALWLEGSSIRDICRSLATAGYRPRNGNVWRPGFIHSLVAVKTIADKKKISSRLANAKAVIMMSETDVIQ